MTAHQRDLQAASVNHPDLVHRAAAGKFLLPDGYPGSEYLICRIYLIGFSELVQ